MVAVSEYRGRFAPTPSGPLHFGSLIAALASYLDARANHGQWLVRIEDIDAPRVVAGADQRILEQLKQHELHWDGEVWYQSQRTEVYHRALSKLTERQLTYRCECSRKQIKERGLFYTGVCRDKYITARNTAVRFRNDQPVTQFIDGLQGEVTIEPEFAAEDFVLYRRDGLFTYQLAVVIDDIEQGITDIVRGEDLLTPTSWQINLWRQFSGRLPQFKHVPLALDANGRKLSKQNHAPALCSDRIIEQLTAAMKFLQLQPLATQSAVELLSDAVTQWRTRDFPKTARQVTM